MAQASSRSHPDTAVPPDPIGAGAHPRTQVVLHVVEAFGGGVFVSVTQTVNGLAARGCNVHLAFAERAETPRPLGRYLDPRITLHPVPLSRSLHPVRDLIGLFALLRLFFWLRPNVVHLHSSKAGFTGRIAAYLTGVAAVFYSPRGLPFLQENHGRVTRGFYCLLEQVAARFGGAVIACSESEMQEVRRNIRPARAHLVPNAVDPTPIVPRRDRADGPCRLGTLGRVGPQKDPLAFLRMVHDLTGEDVAYTWIGGGDPEMARCLEAAGVAVTGWLDRGEALERLADLDVYIQTSRWEGMPIAVMEAQLAGIPAVVTNVVGNRDVVLHGITGFVANGPSDLAAHVATLAHDVELRLRMGAAARRHALANFSVDRMIDQLLTVYGLPMPPLRPAPAQSVSRPTRA